MLVYFSTLRFSKFSLLEAQPFCACSECSVVKSSRARASSIEYLSLLFAGLVSGMGVLDQRALKGAMLGVLVEIEKKKPETRNGLAFCSYLVFDTFFRA
jgi:hypothetical protein